MKSRALILILVLGLGAIAVGWVYESRLRPRVERAELTIPDNIDFYLANMNYRALDETGKLDYEFQSPRLEHHQRNDVSLIEIPSLQIYRETDLWSIDALQGEFEHAVNLLRLRDRVVMKKTGADPIEMRTEGIRFEPDLDLVTSEASVLMLSNRARIEAETAVFDLAGKVYRLGKARAIYYRDDN